MSADICPKCDEQAIRADVCGNCGFSWIPKTTYEVSEELGNALNKLEAFDASEPGRPDSQAELAGILDDLCTEWKKLKEES